MPLPRRLARFNKRVTNPVARLVAGWMPGLAIVTHTGRVSARHYRTPVNIFRSGDRYVFALTYGAGTDWVRTCWQQGAARSVPVARSSRSSTREARRRPGPTPGSRPRPVDPRSPGRRRVPGVSVARPGEDHRYAADHGSSPTTPGAERQALRHRKRPGGKALRGATVRHGTQMMIERARSDGAASLGAAPGGFSDDRPARASDAFP